VGLHKGLEIVLTGLGDVMSDGLGEELIGGGQALFAVPEQDAGPFLGCATRALAQEGGLAETRFSGDEEDLTIFLRRRTLERGGDLVEFGLAADHAEQTLDGRQVVSRYCAGGGVFIGADGPAHREHG
jgi:hypothetical protein